MSNQLLDEPADLNAEIGSKSWARAVAREIRFSAEKLDFNVDHIQEFISIASKHEAWRVLGYVSLDAFLIAEASFTQEIIDAIRQAKSGTKLSEITALAQWGGDRKSEHVQVDNINLKTKGGTDTEYTLRRLARDAPELLGKIESGELSVNQAAIQAGIRKKPTPASVCIKSFTKCDDKLTLTKSLLALLDETQRLVVHEWLQTIVVDTVDT